MWDFNVAMVVLSREDPSKDHRLAGVDVAEKSTPPEKALALATARLVHIGQKAQLSNPEAKLSFEEASRLPLLAKYAEALVGIQSGDDPRFVIQFWEVRNVERKVWEAFQMTPDELTTIAGCTSLIRWEQERGDLCCNSNSRLQGLDAVGKPALLIHRMGGIFAYRFGGERFHQNVVAVVPRAPANLQAIWCYCSSPDFLRSVRGIDQALKVTNATLVKVPFDLAHWQKVAGEKYPHGLPKPFSNDPTQWLFSGHPKGADQPLHVAVARLLGYRWPRQTGSSFPDCPALESDGLEELADEDGIVCLSALRGERAASDRLRSLISAALGSYDEHSLIAATGSKARSLEDWLSDDFFAQHCQLFHQRPFIWHIWDGLTDGFHALVNYHKLAAADGAGRKLLETLTFSYLGDWIKKQQDDIAHKKPGAEDRLVAAQALQTELKAILAGVPPYDLFVRWKPLHQLAIGWAPDINDGVRLNIRPFMLATDVGRKGAGILRAKPGIKWDKDRGKEPERSKVDFPWFWSWDEASEDFGGGSTFDGNRWNDCHYTPAAKRAARERQDNSRKQ